MARRRDPAVAVRASTAGDKQLTDGDRNIDRNVQCRSSTFPVKRRGAEGLIAHSAQRQVLRDDRRADAVALDDQRVSSDCEILRVLQRSRSDISARIGDQALWPTACSDARCTDGRDQESDTQGHRD